MDSPNENRDCLANENEELRRKLSAAEQALSRLKQELTESNRGVIALHAELSDKSEALRRASEVKARVLANVGHEFRAPLHSVLGLSKLLLGEADGRLGDEQQQQVMFIRKSAESLAILIDDLLDLAKLEAGKATLRPSRFKVEDLFAALRGTLRPLLPTDSVVSLEFELAPDLPQIETDEGKTAQVLRNLITNALKFTEKGEVRIVAERVDPEMIRFVVKDTGIGIAPQDQARIFDDFTQIDSSLQRRVKGTGLGLSLSRRLVERLGGTLTVSSVLGRGSTFVVMLPVVHPEIAAVERLAAERQVAANRPQVLVLEDDPAAVLDYERVLGPAGFHVVAARSVTEARQHLERMRPAAMVVDVMLEGETSWRFVADVKSSPETRGIPMVMVTVSAQESRAQSLGVDEFWLKPIDERQLLVRLGALTRGAPHRILVIDDDAASRYLLKKMLLNTPFTLLEAATGAEGLELARREKPALIILDYVLDDRTALEVLRDLKGHAETREVPIIVSTSQKLDPEVRDRLAGQAAAVVSKDELSPNDVISRLRTALQTGGLRPNPSVNT